MYAFEANKHDKELECAHRMRLHGQAYFSSSESVVHGKSRLQSQYACYASNLTRCTYGGF